MSKIIDLYWKKKSQEIDENEEDIFGPSKRKRRFRASIYVDVWVPETDDLEKDREEAKKVVEEYRENIPNSYVGDVGFFISQFKLDREL